MPLSFDWDGEALLTATPTDNPTGRNLAATVGGPLRATTHPITAGGFDEAVPLEVLQSIRSVAARTSPMPMSSPIAVIVRPVRRG